MSRRTQAARRAALGLAAALALAACASLPRPGGEPAVAGRLAVQAEGGRSLSAGFELLGDAERGSLSLSTPLGTLLAQASWAPRRPTLLVTPQGRSEYADLPALTRELVGEELPVAALFDWLRGRPWPGAASRPSEPPDEAGFVQLGWLVALARLDAGVVVARRIAPPPLTVRARIDSATP